MKQVHTWWNAVVEINKIVKSGNPAYLGVKEFSVVVSDQPIRKAKYELIIFSRISKKELKSEIMDYLSRAYLIHDNDTVQSILIMLALIEQWESNKWE